MVSIKPPFFFFFFFESAACLLKIIHLSAVSSSKKTNKQKIQKDCHNFICMQATRVLQLGIQCTPWGAMPLEMGLYP